MNGKGSLVNIKNRDFVKEIDVIQTESNLRKLISN